MISKIATRDGYGKKLSELTDERIVVLTADLADSSRVKDFAEKHPQRFIQVGISEQDMFGMANGLAVTGKIPITNTFAAFCLRGHEQIRLIAINNANVKIAGQHSGISLGADGVSQMCEEDISLFRTMPNFTVVVPCDALEAQKALESILTINGPCYLRLSREPFPVVTNEYSDFHIGKANVLRDGDDVLIVACGTMVSEALRAAQLLKEKNISACVMNMHTIKPLDKDALLKYAQKIKAVVTAEEHSIYGGLGSAVAEALSTSKIPVKILGIDDVFGESGTAQELFQKFGLTAEKIVENCIAIANHKETVNGTFKDVDTLVKDIPTETPKSNNNGYDPRGRIIRMSDSDKAKVDAVLNKMFGGRKN
jgi:transketolase